MKRTLILTVVAVLAAVIGYLFGYMQGDNNGVRRSNAASLSQFMRIHMDLNAGRVDQAIKGSEASIASHAGVIQAVEDHPTVGLSFLYPGVGDPMQSNYKAILGGAGVYLSQESTDLPDWTLDFLARYKSDYEQASE